MQLPAQALAAIEKGDTAGAVSILREQTGLDYAAAEKLIEAYLVEHGSPLAELPPAAIQFLAAGRKARARWFIQQRFGIDEQQAERLISNWAAATGRNVDDMARTRLWTIAALAALAAVLYLALSGALTRVG